MSGITVFDKIASGEYTRLQMQKLIDKDSSQYGEQMTQIAVDVWKNPNLISGWRDRSFLAQVFKVDGVIIRISVNRSEIAKSGKVWKDGITWDDLQRIKNELGFEDFTAVEVFPPQELVVNVANMRHLFVLPKTPSYVWQSRSDV